MIKEWDNLLSNREINLLSIGCIYALGKGMYEIHEGTNKVSDIIIYDYGDSTNFIYLYVVVSNEGSEYHQLMYKSINN